MYKSGRDIMVNDRVRFVPQCIAGHRSYTFPCDDERYDDLIAHPYGTVRAFDFDGDVIVEFDDISTGHSCDGIVPSYRGLYINYKELVPVKSDLIVSSISNLI